jgi:thermitase
MKKYFSRHWKGSVIFLSLLVIGVLVILHNPANLYSQVESQTVKVGSFTKTTEILVRVPQDNNNKGGLGLATAQVAPLNSGPLEALRKELGAELVDELTIRPRQEDLSILPAATVQTQSVSSEGTYSSAWQVWELSSESQAAQAIDNLNDQGITAEPNYKVYKAYVPNDPKYGQQWALPRIQAPEAWDLETGSSSTKVAVIDTGCDIEHPDLELNINKSLSYDFLNDDSEPEDDSDDSHGTHVAGIIAAVGDNTKGVAGLNWKADLLIYKSLDAAGEGTIDKLILAIQRAIDDGAQVINMSWGTEDNSLALHEALQAAYDSDIVLVAAAGNQGKLLYPAKYEEVLGVAGTAKADGDPRWSAELDGTQYESAYGKEIDVAGPAEEIYSTIKSQALEELSYGALSGTSMSAAFVSGEAGLLLSQEAKLTREEIYGIIKGNVDPVTTESSKPIGSGRINLFKAVKSVADGTYNRAPQAQISATPQEGNAPLKVEFSAEGSTDDDGEIVKYSWEFGDGKTGEGKEVSYTYKDAGEYIVRLKVKDDKGALGTARKNIKVKSASGVGGDEALIAGEVEAIEEGEKGSLSGAVVSASSVDGDSLATAESDDDGKYELKITKEALEESGIEPIKKGVYEIVVTAEAEGFKLQEKETTARLGKKLTLNFLLRPEPDDDGGGGGGGGRGGKGKGKNSGGCASPIQGTISGTMPFQGGGGLAWQCNTQGQCGFNIQLPPMTGANPTPTPAPK